LIGPYDFLWTSIDRTVYIAKFQQTELHENHLWFWLEAEQFKFLPTDELKGAAYKICHDYIYKGAERGVSDTLLLLKAVFLPCISFHRLTSTIQFAGTFLRTCTNLIVKCFPRHNKLFMF